MNTVSFQFLKIKVSASILFDHTLYLKSIKEISLKSIVIINLVAILEDQICLISVFK